MKWFKHLSGSLNDSFIFELVEDFGGDGYMAFFGTLEIMADEFDIYNPGVSTISIKKLTKNLQLSRQKTLKILRFCDEKAKKDPRKKVSFFVDIGKTHVTIKCSKLAMLCDTHTSKLVRDTSKSIRSDIEVTSSQEVRSRSRSRSKKKEKKVKDSPKFDIFWKEYPRKQSKDEARKAWEKIDTTNGNLEKIMKGLELAKRSQEWKKDNGQYIPHPSTWLNKKRWTDEYTINPLQGKVSEVTQRTIDNMKNLELG